MNSSRHVIADRSRAGRRLRGVRLTALAILALAVAAVAGCGGQQPNTVTVHDLKFDPQTVTVPKGTTVTWTNKDEIPVQIQSDNFSADKPSPGQFSSDPLNPGESFTLRFDNAGQYRYSDTLHPYMTGTLVVQ